MTPNLKTTAEAVLAGEKIGDNKFVLMAINQSGKIAQGYLNLLKKYEILERAIKKAHEYENPHHDEWRLKVEDLLLVALEKSRAIGGEE